VDHKVSLANLPQIVRHVGGPNRRRCIMEQMYAQKVLQSSRVKSQGGQELYKRRSLIDRRNYTGTQHNNAQRTTHNHNHHNHDQRTELKLIPSPFLLCFGTPSYQKPTPDRQPYPLQASSRIRCVSRYYRSIQSSPQYSKAH
jgi:hypothetical protein